MLDIAAQSRAAAATADMMRTCAVATARIAAAATLQGLSTWARMLHATPVEPACAPVCEAQAEPVATAPAGASPADAFARYRSAGGHAAAQVMVA